MYTFGTDATTRVLGLTAISATMLLLHLHLRPFRVAAVQHFQTGCLIIHCSFAVLSFPHAVIISNASVTTASLMQSIMDRTNILMDILLLLPILLAVGVFIRMLRLNNSRNTT